LAAPFMLTTITAYRTISQNYDRTVELTKSSPMVKRETDYYRETIGNITSVDDFLNDTRVFNYAMKAFGLDDFMYAKGFMRKALEGGIDADDSFANKLTDPRFKEFVTTFNFERYGATTTKFTRTQDGTIDRYVRMQLETNAGQDNDAVRLALNFQRKAPDITTAYGILADRAMLEVVKTALQLPDTFSAYDIDKQAEVIASKLDIADFKDPEKLNDFIERFALMWDVSTGAASQPSILPLFATGNSTSSIGISTDLLMSMQLKKSF
jgi:hypothetical protein